MHTHMRTHNTHTSCDSQTRLAPAGPDKECPGGGARQGDLKIVLFYELSHDDVAYVYLETHGVVKFHRTFRLQTVACTCDP